MACYCRPQPNGFLREGCALRFFRTPKGLLTIIFAILLAIAAPAAGIGHVWAGLVVGSIAAMLIDAAILRFRNKNQDWEFPSGALLTAVIVSMVLSPEEPWHVVAITSVIAVISKYVFRVRTANVFNPAALALVVTFYLFNTGQSWWGAMTDAGWLGLVVLIVTTPLPWIAVIVANDRSRRPTRSHLTPPASSHAAAPPAPVRSFPTPPRPRSPDGRPQPP